MVKQDHLAMATHGSRTLLGKPNAPSVILDVHSIVWAILESRDKRSSPE